jgi:purine-binding chemotaxis protein CheW
MKGKSKTAAKQIVQQEQALDLYFKNMLEGLLPTPDDTAPAVEVKTKARKEKVVPVAKVALPATVEKRTESVQSEKKLEQAAQKVHPLSVMPEWSQQEFQALFFVVGKMTLAVPLTELLRTIEFNRKVSKIPEQPSWFLGLMDELDSRIGVLDTGQLLFGKVYGLERDLQKKPYQSILITTDGRWGLACDSVLSIGKLTPEKVRWRTLRKKRPWLIGTVIDELITVIDVSTLVPHRKGRHE